MINVTFSQLPPPPPPNPQLSNPQRCHPTAKSPGPPQPASSPPTLSNATAPPSNTPSRSHRLSSHPTIQKAKAFTRRSNATARTASAKVSFRAIRNWRMWSLVRELCVVALYRQTQDVSVIETGIADVFCLMKEHRGEYYCAAKKHPHWFCKLCGSSIPIVETTPILVTPYLVLITTAGCTLGTNLTWICENVMRTEPRATINLRMLRDIRPSELQKRHEGFMRTQ